jgi:hypothetical protein
MDCAAPIPKFAPLGRSVYGLAVPLGVYNTNGLIKIKEDMLYLRMLASALLLIIGTASPLSAKPFDLGSWNIINIKYNYTSSLSFFGEGQIRSLKFYNYFHYYEFKGGINYKLGKAIQFTLGAGSYQTYREGGNFELPKNNAEFRLWPQITLFQEIGNIKLEHRYRSELRWTSNGYRNRFRYRIGVAYPFGSKKNGYQPFQVGISNELFFKDDVPYFERNRIQMTFNYKINNHSTLQTGYLHQFDYKINDETGRDFLVVGFYYDLNRKQASKTADKQAQ